MEAIKNIFDFIFHLDGHLDTVVRSFGNWTYLMLFAIIFAETGLVITPFLPGDSLLFVLGALAAKGTFSFFWTSFLLIGAAIIGDTVNYSIGKFFGEKILLTGTRRFIKKEHIDKTHRFYEKHGGKTIILARFIPIIRTFAPFVAGIARMNYFKFLIYNVTGGFLWILVFMTAGYYFGNLPVVKSNFSLVIFAIVIISVLPVAMEYLKHRRRKIACVLFLACFIYGGSAFAQREVKEEIFYDISPIGTSVYRNYGEIEFRGRKVNLTVFETEVAGFRDREVIYSDPKTGLPYWVERNISDWFGKEFITEDYRQNDTRLLIIKYKDGKKVQEYKFESKGPIDNAILIPFSLRNKKGLKVGWSSDIRLPQAFKVECVSVEEVTVSAGKFKAYHFTSTPPKFEIWISADELRLPVKIKGLGGIPYALVMNRRIVNKDKR